MTELTKTGASGDDSEQSAKAMRIIRTHMLGSAAAGLFQVPLIDIGVVGGVQLRMLAKLAKLYEVEFSEQRANALIGTLAGVGVAWTARGLLGLVPGAGRILAGVGGLVLPAASTYALGRVFSRHFESGGTFVTFDAERAKGEYEEEVVEGKRVVERSYAGVRP